MRVLPDNMPACAFWNAATIPNAPNGARETTDVYRDINMVYFTFRSGT